jgi:hypothetical protein
MGHQQLLLYTLGLLIAGAAILVGIQKFNASHREASIDALQLDLLTIAAKAQLYYHTPKNLDGGNYSFSGLTNNPDDLKKLFVNSENENGSFKIISGTDNFLAVHALGNNDYDGDGTNLTIEMKVYPDSMHTEVINY